MLIAMAGLPGTGKSTLARALAARLPAILLDKDRLRAALFPPEMIEYSFLQDDFCVGIMLQLAEYYLQKDPQRRIILDGRTFTRRYQVRQVLDFCESRGMEVRFIECICSEEKARLRLESAALNGEHLAENRSYLLYQQLKAQAEPIDLAHFSVDTGENLSACVRKCLDYLN